MTALHGLQETGSLIQAIDRWADADPNKIAFRYYDQGDTETETLTFGTLRADAVAASAAIAELSAPGDRVLVLSTGLAFVRAFFGCLFAGRIPVPAPAPSRGSDLGTLTAIAKNCSAVAAVASRKTLDLASGGLAAGDLAAEDLGAGDLGAGDLGAGLPDGLSGIRWRDDDTLRSAAGAAGDIRPPKPDQIAFLQYTSGSTGAPKGVIVTHANVMANLAMIRDWFAVDSSDRGVSWLPMHHDMGLIGGVLLPVFAGGEVSLMDPRRFLQRPLRWLRMIAERNAVLSGGPNFAYDLCCERIDPADLDGIDLSCWQIAFNGAEPIRAATLERFVQRFGPLGFDRRAFMPGYGLAEATVMATASSRAAEVEVLSVDARILAGERRAEPPQGDTRRDLVACGPAKGLTDITILDPQGADAIADGLVGEIALSGANVSPGYWPPDGRIDAVEAVRNIRFRTGDLGFIHDGQLYVSGRLKDQIIVRGRNIDPADLEVTAGGPCGGAAGAAIGLDTAAGEAVGLLQEVPRHIAAQGSPDGLASRIAAAVADRHQISPAVVVLLRPGSLPRTSSGKIQRQEARERYRDGRLRPLHEWRPAAAGLPEVDGDAPAGVSALLDRVNRAVAKTLKLRESAVDPDRNFAELGLDSVAAIDLAVGLAAIDPLFRDFDPVLLWTHSTPRALADHLAGRLAGTRETGPAGLPDTGRVTAVAPRVRARETESRPSISLMFFSAAAGDRTGEGYRLLTEAAKFADRRGFEAIWVPERHFHVFGGLYPNPSVTAAALAMITDRIRLRAGSVVLPLQDPLRVAEEWAVVDNLSRGRVDIGFAKGFNPDDFVLDPSAFPEREAVFANRLDDVRRLWRGETVLRRNGKGLEREIRIQPRPVQPTLPVWITAAESEASFVEAGRLGANVLTAMLRLTAEQLAARIRAYREARRQHGHDPDSGRVTVMLHAYVHPDGDHVRRHAETPFRRYLRESTNLWRGAFPVAEHLTPDQEEQLLDYACRRYLDQASLIGVPDKCRDLITTLSRAGVNEIAGLVDFGVPTDAALAALGTLADLALPAGPPAPAILSRSRRDEEDEPIDGAALAPVPAAVLGLGASRDAVSRLWLDGRPHRIATIRTFAGRIGLYVLPTFADALRADRDALYRQCVGAIADAARHGADRVALTGLLPGVSHYGRAIRDAADSAGIEARITTGHGYTVAAVVLTLERLLARTGRRLAEETVAVVGLGSIGAGVLHLLLAEGRVPRSLVLADLESRRQHAETLRADLRPIVDGGVSFALAGPGGVHDAVYEAGIVIGASSEAGILDVERLRPGTIVVDDSAPRCFDEAQAMARARDRGDILFTEGGSLHLPRPFTVSVPSLPVGLPSGFDVAVEGLIAPVPDALTACILSSVLGGAETLGPVDLAASGQALSQLRALGCMGATPHSGGLRFSEAEIAAFAERFPRSS